MVGLLHFDSSYLQSNVLECKYDHVSTLRIISDAFLLLQTSLVQVKGSASCGSCLIVSFHVSACSSLTVSQRPSFPPFFEHPQILLTFKAFAFAVPFPGTLPPFPSTFLFPSDHVSSPFTHSFLLSTLHFEKRRGPLLPAILPLTLLLSSV